MGAVKAKVAPRTAHPLSMSEGSWFKTISVDKETTLNPICEDALENYLHPIL